MGGGRFAPSPTGELHFGSLLAAMASLCGARHAGKPWRLRIDDIDGPRSVAGSAAAIQSALQVYRMPWDGDVIWQSQNHDRYTDALRNLVAQGLVFRCSCSRRSLPPGKPYPGTCWQNRLTADELPVHDHALRLVMPERIVFEDEIQGLQSVYPAQDIGDIIIWRRDQLVSYSLACAIDDATDCSQVVRGADLLPSTAAQIAIMRYLSLPVPEYAHIPVAIDENNDKLSKHSRAAPISGMDPLLTLKRAWHFLGQVELQADNVEAFWSGALPAWDCSRIPRRLRAFENGT